MGLIERLFTLVFGGGRNVVRETAEVFRENAEAGAARNNALQTQVITQHGAEFDRAQKGGFDRFMDGVNRLPRPLMAFGILGLFIAAMVDPVWFASRMQGLALVPDPLWWLLGAIVSFYFGARHQFKGQEFQQSITETMLRVPQVVENIRTLNALSPKVAAQNFNQLPETNGKNAAIEDWKRAKS